MISVLNVLLHFSMPLFFYPVTLSQHHDSIENVIFYFINACQYNALHSFSRNHDIAWPSILHKDKGEILRTLICMPSSNISIFSEETKMSNMRNGIVSYQHQIHEQHTPYYISHKDKGEILHTLICLYWWRNICLVGRWFNLEECTRQKFGRDNKKKNCTDSHECYPPTLSGCILRKVRTFEAWEMNAFYLIRKRKHTTTTPSKQHLFIGIYRVCYLAKLTR